MIFYSESMLLFFLKIFQLILFMSKSTLVESRKLYFLFFIIDQFLEVVHLMIAILLRFLNNLWWIFHC